MRTYMARLGSFQFGMETAAFNDLKRTSNYRWEAKNRIGRKPAMQNTGRDADTITLSGVIYPHWRGGLGQMATLRAMADTGQAQPLVYAFENAGQYCGKWCITAIDETRTVLFDNGSPRKIEFSLTLREYGEDGDTAQLVPAFPSDVTNVLSSTEVSSIVDTSAAVRQAADIDAGVQAIANQSEAVASMPSAVAVLTSVTYSISDGISKVLNSDAVKLAKRTVIEVGELKNRAEALAKGTKGLKDAIKDPSKLQTALAGMGTAAGAASETMTKAANGLALTSGNYGGKGPATLYSKQVTSAATVLNQLSSASRSIQSAVSTLWGHFD